MAANNGFRSNIYQYTIIGLFLLSMLLESSYAQQHVYERHQLSNQRISLKHDSLYFLSDVVDLRDTLSHNKQLLGTIIAKGQRTALQLSSTTESAIYRLFQPSLPFKDSLQLPLVVAIDTLQINEKTMNGTSISGQLTISLSFHWYRQHQKVDLVTYQATQQYTRSAQTTIDHVSLVENSLIKGIQYFDKWMELHHGRNPALATSISLRFQDYVPPTYEKDTVFFQPNRPITWNDFQAQPSSSSKYAALIFTSFAYEGHTQLLGSQLQVTLFMKVYMVKNMSWRKSIAADHYALAHEQLHFDIVQVIANRFKQHLSSIELSLEDYDSQIQYAFIEFYRQMNHLQKAYDDETKHGLNPTMQHFWYEKIKKELAQSY